MVTVPVTQMCAEWSPPTAQSACGVQSPDLSSLTAAHHAALKTGNGLIDSLVALAKFNNTRGRN